MGARGERPPAGATASLLAAAPTSACAGPPPPTLNWPCTTPPSVALSQYSQCRSLSSPPLPSVSLQCLPNPSPQSPPQPHSPQSPFPSVSLPSLPSVSLQCLPNPSPQCLSHLSPILLPSGTLPKPLPQCPSPITPQCLSPIPLPSVSLPSVSLPSLPSVSPQSPSPVSLSHHSAQCLSPIPLPSVSLPSVSLPSLPSVSPVCLSQLSPISGRYFPERHVTRLGGLWLGRLAECGLATQGTATRVQGWSGRARTMNQAAESGPWERKERLGAGGFGHVCMWQNKDNGEQRAVKTCRMELSPRNRERWVLEIQIMKRLNHPNVVSAREVPEEMEKALGPRDLPLLAMEYCSGGDLRKVLLKPENCCGMRECDVMAVIYDISQAVQYLHTNRIIHRDLKPENIVLQQQQDRVIYKIIDLGYAKELDQGSLCTSFVGTLQYLAPELFEGQKYTVSVDYWSFGTVVFECITGFRPFLPNMQPVQWHSIVIRKGPHDIVAVEEMNRDIKFSSHIPAPHNLNSVLAVQLEHWLQLMLFWNARQRGGPVDEGTGRPTCFLILDTILTSKTVHILNMVTGEVLAYTVRPDESLQHLQEQVMASTTIPVADQELLFETGIMLDPRKPVDQCLPEGCWNMSLVYLFDKSREEYGVQLRVPKIPDLVSYIVSESKTLLSYMQQRRAFGQAYHYVRSMKEHLGRLQQGQRAAMLSLLRYNSSLTKLRSFTAALAQQLKAKLEFFLSSLQLDLEKYEEQMNSGISSKKMHSAWLEMKEKAKALVQNTEVVEVDEKLLAVQGQIVALQRSPTARRQGDVLENTEQKAMELYKQLREKPSDQRVYGDSVEMVKLIIHAVQNLEKLMKELCLFLGKMVVCKNEISSLMPRLEESVECMKEADRALTRMQDKRQKDIWSLLKFAMVESASDEYLVRCVDIATRETKAKSKQSPMSASPDSGSLGQVPLWPSSPPGASTTSASSSSANVNGVASAAAAVAPSGPTPGPTTPNSLHSMAAERCEASLMLIAEGHSQMSRCVDVIQETLREQKLDLKTLDWSWLSS